MGAYFGKMSSPDGQMLASGGYEDSTISLWDVRT